MSRFAPAHGSTDGGASPGCRSAAPSAPARRATDGRDDETPRAAWPPPRPPGDRRRDPEREHEHEHERERGYEPDHGRKRPHHDPRSTALARRPAPARPRHAPGDRRAAAVSRSDRRPPSRAARSPSTPAPAAPRRPCARAAGCRTRASAHRSAARSPASSRPRGSSTAQARPAPRCSPRGGAAGFGGTSHRPRPGRRRRRPPGRGRRAAPTASSRSYAAARRSASSRREGGIVMILSRADDPVTERYPRPALGAVAEWLRSGLQSRLLRFESGRRL